MPFLKGPLSADCLTFFLFLDEWLFLGRIISGGLDEGFSVRSLCEIIVWSRAHCLFYCGLPLGAGTDW